MSSEGEVSHNTNMHELDGNVPVPLLAMQTEESNLLVMNDGSTIEETPLVVENHADENDAAKIKKTLEDKLAQENEERRSKSIKLARKNAAGKLVMSAEPYNFFQDMAETRQCLRDYDLVVQFRIPYNFMSSDITVFLNNVGIKHEDIAAMGRKPKTKKVLISFHDKLFKRNLMNKINSNFSTRYKAWTLEEDEINVTLTDVPHRMSDTVLREALSKFGKLDPAETVINKCDLGFYNLERSVVFTSLEYDIPSFLKVAGYTLQVRYNGQPKTCMKCGTRSHMVDKCPLNTRASLKQPTPPTTINQENTSVQNIADAVEETLKLVRHHPGINVNNPEFKSVLSKQLARFEELATKRQEQRFNELKKHHEEDNSHMDPKRKRSYAPGNDNLPDTFTAASDGFTRVGRSKYSFPQNSTTSKVPLVNLTILKVTTRLLSLLDEEDGRRTNKRGAGHSKGNGDRRSCSCVIPSNAVRSIFSGKYFFYNNVFYSSYSSKQQYHVAHYQNISVFSQY